MGAPAKPVRMALGALIIKEKCGYTDEETVEQIQENPYLQYFIGLTEYQDQAPFDPSMMVHFRKRLNGSTMQEISGEGGNHGQLILDATCAPADIRYPTDLSLLNEVREKLEAVIDTLHKPLQGKTNKPRTYRKKARKDYLQAAKRRKLRVKVLRKAVGKQLRYVGRNLRIIDRMLERNTESILSRKQIQDLYTIRKLYRQQKTMYEQGSPGLKTGLSASVNPMYGL